MRMNDSLIIRPEPRLTYDASIYWLLPYFYCEVSISREVLRDSQIDVLAYTRRDLQRQATAEAGKARWAAYTTVEEQQNKDYNLILRYNLYEQPGFLAYELYQAPPALTTLRRLINDPSRTIV